VKIGICPSTPSGKLKKPEGEKLLDFIVGNFKKEEFDQFKKISKEVAEVLKTIVLEGRERAMNEFNQG
jgi:peptidyl-tRNA hydrolase